ncbi:hypothetical protein N7523_011164 [Penicillium sp. IBT 18751x]|nr:hypothetical protein N7523_011164 [Penicillium sp. IBT 18751x]
MSQPPPGSTTDDHANHRRIEGQVLDNQAAGDDAFFVHRQSQRVRHPEKSSSPTYDLFQGSAFLSRYAILGDDFPGIDVAHRDGEPPLYNLSPLELQALHLYGAFELPGIALRQSLVDAFFDRCWSWSPVLEFEVTGAEQKSSLVIFQAVLMAGGVMRPRTCSPEMVSTFYRRAKALLDVQYEEDPLVHVAAAVILQWYTPTPVNDISTDVPRFWMTSALAIAHQLGLHREPSPNDPERHIRRRIWWSIYTCDCLSAAAEGRPRLINLEDCSVNPPNLEDFPPASHAAAALFVCYVEICGIVSDLCQVLARRGEISIVDRERVEARLKAYIQSFPDQLRLYNPGSHDSYRLFNFQAAQLHIHFLTTITILYRPRSLCYPAEENAPSYVAASLCCEIFEAIHLRELVPFLGTIFSWHILVVAVAQISWSRITGLREKCRAALDTVEKILESFVATRPAAANNLRNIRTIRRAVLNREVPVPTQLPTPTSSLQDHIDLDSDTEGRSGVTGSAIPELLRWYGPKVALHYESVVQTFRRHCALLGQRVAGKQHDEREFERPGGLGCKAHVPASDPHPDMGDSNLSVYDLDDHDPEELRNNPWMRELVEELELVYNVVM